VQTSTVDEFHYQEDLLVRFKCFVKLSYVGMVKFFHDFHLTLDTFATIRFHELDLFIDFYSYLLVEHLVESETNNGIGTLAYPFTYEVIVEVLDRAILSVEFDHVLVRLPFALVHLCFI